MFDPKAIIRERHYTRSWPSGKSFVYTFEDAIVVFSIPANYNIGKWLGCRVWELTRLWAPDGHRANLLTQAIARAVKEFSKLDLADVVISYADPSAGHHGGVYKAASWQSLGQCEETRSYRDSHGNIVARRKFHSGRKSLRKAEIESMGYVQVKAPGKLRFARSLTKAGRRAIESKTPRAEA